jgi:hypothetical protein
MCGQCGKTEKFAGIWKASVPERPRLSSKDAVFFGHRDVIFALVMDPDGKRLRTVSA